MREKALCSSAASSSSLPLQAPVSPVSPVFRRDRAKESCRIASSRLEVREVAPEVRVVPEVDLK